MAEFLDGQDTRLCDNCKKEIPVFNFTIHEIHCQRNIGMCPICKEPFPKSDMETHMATEHCQVTCKCNKKLEKRQLKKHEETECPLRLALCQHCDLELSVLKLKDHEDYCGARTELCGSCGRNVLVKDLKTHPEVCGRDVEEKRDEVAVPPNAYDDSWGQDGIWIASQLRQIEALDPRMRLPRRSLRAFESDLFQSRTTNQRSMTAQFPIQNNLLEEQERQERNRSRQTLKEGGEDSANLDFMLALSLQNEGQAPNLAEQDFWRVICEADQSHEGPGALNDIRGAADETMLPCEFCEELYPEELLIDHQKLMRQAASNQLDSLMGLSSSPPVEDSIIIPCEFCGVQLEEEVLFHHQLNNLDSQGIQGRSRNSHNGALAPGHVPVVHSARSLYPENLVPSFPCGPSGRYGASGRSEGGRNPRVTPTTASYRSRTAKAKPPKQQGAGDAEEEEEEE
ncbi:hypothetical protein J1605_015476 [Eschrichtius robustus]|uniref:TRAF-type zinc finger domain-containing protein 1 n=1 Tax=Eschrichtius robustus TaxID=9764 RepID=A0AB34GBA2_ESCRO|nr:hypothetical protein J1605_015476 [Eschrichtius robustus]